MTTKLGNGWKRALALACAVAVGGCGASAADDLARRDRALAKGAEFYAAENWEKARVEYRNALQAAPNDAEVRYRNGRVAEQLGNLREAAQFYQGAVDIDPGHADARADLARAYLFSGVPQRAMEIVAVGLEKHPDHVALLTVRAAARARLGDVPGAFQDAERAYGLDAKNESTIAVLAGLYDSNARSDRAREVLEAGVRAHPRSVSLRLALAQLYTSLDRDGDAERELRALVELTPDELPHRIRLAQFLAGHSKDTDAEKVLREALARAPADTRVRGALVAFLQAKRGKEAALAQLRSFAADASDGEAQFALAGFLAQNGDEKGAEQIYRDVIAREKTAPTGLSARTRLATLLAQRGDAAGATELVQAVLQENPRDNDALILRGNLLLAKRDAAGAIADLRAVLRDQPNATGVQRALARAHLANGEPALAEEALRRALDSAPADAGLRRDLSQLLLEQGRAEQAKPLLEALGRDRPDDFEVFELLFRAAVGTRDVAAARFAAETMRTLRPTIATTHLYSGMVAEAEKKNDDALREYDAALAIEPNGGEPLQALTNLLVRTGRANDAVARLENAAANSPVALPLLLKGQVLLQQKRIPEAEAAFRAGIERAPTSWVLHRGLALAAVQRGERAEGIRILAAAVPKVDQPQALRADLAQLYEQDGRIDDAVAIYETIVKEAPQLEPAKNNLAMLLATHRRDAASLQRAAELSAGFADSRNAQFLDTYGWVQLQRGDANAALAALERASALDPRSSLIRFHYGMAQLAAGRRAVARDTLQQVVSAGPGAAGYAEAKAQVERLASNAE